ncbi:MAG: hypothetical protein Q9213_005887 [Squamulea squamosa]
MAAASSVMVPLLIHPLFPLFFSNLTTALTLIYTSPRSLIRLGAVPPIFLSLWLSLPTYLKSTGRVPWAAFLAGNTILAALQFVDLALLRQWTFQNHARSLFIERPQQHEKNLAPRSSSHPSFKDKLYFAYFIALSSRHIGTPYEAKCVPPFSSSRPDYVPSRTHFILKRAAIGILSYILLDLTAVLARSQHIANNAVYRPPEHIPVFARLNAITFAEMLTRFQDAMAYYVFCYCLIQCYTNFFACLVVGLRIDKVEYWRPNFGTLQDGYDLRQFWGYVVLLVRPDVYSRS